MLLCSKCGASIGHGNLCSNCGNKCLYCGTVNAKVWKICTCCNKPILVKVQPTEVQSTETLRAAYQTAVARQPVQPFADLTVDDGLRFIFSGRDVLLMLGGQMYETMPQAEWEELR